MNELNAEDKLCIEAIKAIPAKIKENILEYRFRDALFELMNLARTGNKYLADNEPWKIQATDPKRVETVLAVSLEIAGALANCMQPFIPFSSEKLFRMLNLEKMKWDD